MEDCLPTTYQVGQRKFSLEIANYGSPKGPISIQVWGDQGPETRLTVNLPDLMVLLEKNQIFVKRDLTKYNTPHLTAIGFTNTGRTVPYGYFDSVAEIWELK